MPVKKDSTGRRTVQAEAEVPGTPEEVWQAIATGPGISSWFVPSEVEEREGGVAKAHFAPDGSMDSVGKITAWNPPRRYVVETAEGPGGSPVASEWTVEVRSGGSCVVRIVHSWFADNADWDNQFEGHAQGWIAFFRLLRLYLTHFRGQSGSSFQVMGVAPPPKESAWNSLVAPLGMDSAKVGQKVTTAAGAPPLGGVVERAGEPARPEELVVRLEQPAAGIAHMFPLAMGDKVYLTARFYLYGKDAAAAVARAQPAWQKWFSEHLAPVTG